MNQIELITEPVTLSTIYVETFHFSYKFSTIFEMKNH